MMRVERGQGAGDERDGTVHAIPTRWLMIAMTSVAAIILIAEIAIASSVSASAQDIETGRTEFLSKCAVCHGVDGKGNSPKSKDFKTKPSDLTLLAKRNGGVFAADAVHDLIDGRKPVRSHQKSDMPIWGCRHGLPADARKKASKPNPKPKPIESLLDLPCDSESVIRDRISAVVDYLAQIQQR
jgi:mono/diheme cytochrome c family protein